MRSIASCAAYLLLTTVRKVRELRMDLARKNGSPSSPVQGEFMRSLLSFAVCFQSRSRLFSILLMRLLRRR